MAGTIRAQYPDSIRTVLVPCTGRVGADVRDGAGRRACVTAFSAFGRGITLALHILDLLRIELAAGGRTCRIIRRACSAAGSVGAGSNHQYRD